MTVICFYCEKRIAKHEPHSVEEYWRNGVRLRVLRYHHDCARQPKKRKP